MNIPAFLKVASRDLRVGAVMPSSRWAVRTILANVPERLTTVLEYGPGDGVITKKLLERMGPDGKLLAVEANDDFVKTLREGVATDSRVALVHGDATKSAAYAAEKGMHQFDLVISGIPFSMLTDAQRRETVEMTHALLKPGGTFLVYQTSPLMVPYLKKKFAVRVRLEPRNVPPYFVMRATKE